MKKLIFNTLIFCGLVGSFYSVGFGLGTDSSDDTSSFSQNSEEFLLGKEADETSGSTQEFAVTDTIKKVLIFGDSMTGWLGERLQAYGEENDFDVATICWDGATIQKWGSEERTTRMLDQYQPDAVLICLGLNGLLVKNPEAQMGQYLDVMLEELGETPYLWIGPPSWPGKGKGEIINEWLEERLPDGRFFYSADLDIPRQSKTNPHPTRAGINYWMDEIVEYIDSTKVLNFKSLNPPVENTYKRGKDFIYKKMRENL